MDLESIRPKIDFIDDQIIDLLTQRFDLVQDVKAYKKKHQIPVLDASREQLILSKLQNQKYHEQLIKIYQLIMLLSKDMQDK